MHTINNMLRGESTEQSGPPPIHLHSTTLCTHLSDHLKAKIWAKEYVDFADLVYQHATRPLSPSKSAGNDKATSSIAPVGKGHQLQSIKQLTTALLMFAAVYAQRHQQLAMGLFQYCEIVRDIAHTGPPMGWRLYDEHFCSFRQSAPGNFPWDQPRWDLYFKKMYAKPAQNNSSHPFSSTVQHTNRTSFPTGYCWPFQWAHVRRSNAVTTSFELIPFRPLSSTLNAHPFPLGTAGHSNGHMSDAAMPSQCHLN